MKENDIKSSSNNKNKSDPMLRLIILFYAAVFLTILKIYIGSYTVSDVFNILSILK